MDPQEPIHGVIGVDRALGLRVTVRELPLVFCWEATLPTPQILNKKIHLNLNVKFLFFFKCGKQWQRHRSFKFAINEHYVFQGFSMCV